MIFEVENNFRDPDSFYAALIAANEGLSDDQSRTFTLRLVFLLANQVGDAAVLEACVSHASRPFRKEENHG